jgi:hypothetical protein
MKRTFLNAFAQVFFGPKVWGQLQATVRMADNPTMTGTEKRDFALNKLASLGITLLGFMLNFALETAVAHYKLGGNTNDAP